MDDNRGQRRQNEPPLHGASNPRYHQVLHDSTQQRRSFAGAQGDRYRPAPLNTSPSGAGRGMGGSASYSGYYQEPAATAFSASAIPQGAMSYHHSAADYGQADTRQTQGFTGTYNPTAMMYNVQQAAGPQNSAVYDTSQQFSSRQPAGLQMMTTDVAAPYFSSEPTNTANASAMQGQSTSSNGPQVYQQPSLQSYSASGIAALGQMPAQSASASDVRMDDDYPGAASGLDQAYASYQSALKEIFRNIRSGILATASDSLLSVSDWLLSHVTDLGGQLHDLSAPLLSANQLAPIAGLTSDEQTLYSERIKLWDDFNHAWLGILQAQKDMMESGQQLQRSQSLISQEGLEKMGKELVRLCDSVERHGLVDYQYGVAEERIIAILEECLDLYSPADTSGGDGSPSDSRR